VEPPCPTHNELQNEGAVCFHLNPDLKPGKPNTGVHRKRSPAVGSIPPIEWTPGTEAHTVTPPPTASKLASGPVCYPDRANERLADVVCVSACACLHSTARATSGAEVQGRGGPHTASRLRLDPRACGEGSHHLATNPGPGPRRRTP
jgi:hypothetical protein